MKVLFFTSLAVFAAKAVAVPVYDKSQSELALKIVQSNEWSCRYVQKKIIASPADLKHAPSVCSASVYCTGVAGEPFQRKGRARFFLTCTARSHNTCPSLDDCALESCSDSPPLMIENTTLNKITSSSRRTLDDGRECKYESETSAAVLFWRNDGKPSGHFCSRVAVCKSPDGVKTESLSLCRAEKVNQEGKATRYACPRANDCLSNPIGTPGYTEQELAQMEKHQASSSAPATHRP